MIKGIVKLVMVSFGVVLLESNVRIHVKYKILEPVIPLS